jgi:modulator of FtsH protease HflC
MKNTFTLFLGVLIVAVLVVYMITFTVRYDQVAVLTTFDKATPPTRDAQGHITDPGSVKTEPGLYFKWPWPFQKQQAYSTRVNILEDQLEEQQTADGYAVIVQTYLAWRIEDPLAFFINLKTEDNAKKQLNPLLRDVRGIIARYRFDELVNTDASKLKLQEIEKEAAKQLSNRVSQQGYGIAVEQLGIRKIVLPEKVTEKVAERMKATRQRMAADARGEGNAAAATIKSEAKTARDRIVAQAERRASALRQIGDAEAASVYGVFRKNPELAKFIKRIQTMEKFLPHNTTIILPAEEWGLDQGATGDGVNPVDKKGVIGGLKLPPADTQAAAEAGPRFDVQPDGRVQAQGVAIDDGEFKQRLTQGNGPGITLAVDADVKNERLAELLGQLRQANVSHVTLMILPAKAKERTSANN